MFVFNLSNETVLVKTCIWGFRTGCAQTSLHIYLHSLMIVHAWLQELPILYCLRNELKALISLRGLSAWSFFRHYDNTAVFTAVKTIIFR